MVTMRLVERIYLLVCAVVVLAFVLYLITHVQPTG